MPPKTTTFETTLRALIALALVALTACVAQAKPPVARAYPEGDRLFHADSRWLGGDAAISIPLSAERTLWLFGDSFVDENEPYARAGAAFLHNTIAIETGTDPRTAQMQFHWLHDRQGAPTAFFADRTGYWYWPHGGMRVAGGALIVFLHKIKPVPTGLRFASAGYAIARVPNPDSDPAQWQVVVTDQRKLRFDALPGSGVVRDGEHAIALATRQYGTHAGALVRYPLRAFGRGDLTHGEWWLGKGWVGTLRVGKNKPQIVIGDAGAESSLHWDGRLASYVHVASYGFGATTIGLRTAPKLIGPWSAPRMVFRPPESDAPQPYVYAGKAHPQLTGPEGSLLVTYVANSFDPNALMTSEGERKLYWPHFVAVPVEKSQQ